MTEKSYIWLRSLRCISWLTTLTMLFFFNIVKMKYLTTLTTLFSFTDYTHYAAFPSLLLKLNIWLRSLRCFSTLTTLTTLFYFTTIKWKFLTTLTTLFYFTAIKWKFLTTLITLFFFNDYTHYAVLLSPLLKWNIWLRSLRCFSSLTTLTMIFCFTTIKIKYLTTLTTLLFFN